MCRYGLVLLWHRELNRLVSLSYRGLTGCVFMVLCPSGTLNLIALRHHGLVSLSRTYGPVPSGSGGVDAEVSRWIDLHSLVIVCIWYVRHPLAQFLANASCSWSAKPGFIFYLGVGRV